MACLRSLLSSFLLCFLVTSFAAEARSVKAEAVVLTTVTVTVAAAAYSTDLPLGNGEDIWELRKAPTGPNPMHHRANPKKPRSP